MTFPDPVIEIAVEPRTKVDQERMAQALQRLAAEDPSFRIENRHGVGADHNEGNGRATS